MSDVRFKITIECSREGFRHCFSSETTDQPQIAELSAGQLVAIALRSIDGLIPCDEVLAHAISFTERPDFGADDVRDAIWQSMDAKARKFVSKVPK